MLDAIKARCTVSPTDCWEWGGALFENGYGAVKRNQKQYRVHRFVWALVDGHIPDGMLVLHKCDNRKCCNPDHLFLGTQLDNIHDMKRKGRDRFKRDTTTKLTGADAVDILQRREVSNTEMARKYGVSQSLISKIRSGRLWSHVNAAP
jgi:hypothetical protein